MTSNRNADACSKRLRELRGWCRQPLGMQLARAEETLLADILSDLFGYHLVVLDPPCNPDALGASRIMHRVLQTREAGDLPDTPGLIAQAEALPFQSDSIDAFVLPHVLEVAADKHQVLREVDRCLVGEGHVVILGFNPFGWWGLRRLISGSRPRVPWSLPFVGVSRLKDWLSLLGFDIVQTQYFFPYPPWQYGSENANWKILQRLHHERWPLFAGAYVLVARKRLTTLTPIKPRWKHRRGMLPGMAEPHQGRVSSNE